MTEPYDPRRRDAAHDETLRGVLARVRAAAGPKVVIFDLDSTLFDNRPRQVQILREFGLLHHIHPLYSSLDVHILDWDLKGPLVRAGVAPDEAETLYPKVREFWRERFFTSPYCLYDVALPGAARYVAALVAAGATIVYLTGRHEPMREGTHASLVRFGFAAPGMPGVHLLMKPTLEQEDTVFKAEAHAQVRKLGEVHAAFDNEPAHARDLHLAFPHATVVWIDSDHSHGKEAPDPTLPRTFGFVTDL
jgi:hypothetical protein